MTSHNHNEFMPDASRTTHDFSLKDMAACRSKLLRDTTRSDLLNTKIDVELLDLECEKVGAR